MSITIRRMIEADLDDAGRVLAQAFQRASTWHSDLFIYLSLQPDGIFIAHEDGEAIGMVCNLIYPEYAAIGMMAVLPTKQRQGLGTRLMEHSLDWLDQQRVPLVVLDASPAGQSMYEKLGFRPCELVAVLQRQAWQAYNHPSPGVQALNSNNLELITDRDAEVFGTRREGLLRVLLDENPGRAWRVSDGDGNPGGYLIAQRQRIGPWVMFNERGAELLLEAALAAAYDGSMISITVPQENTASLSLLQAYGFTPTRVNRHMVRGSGLPAGDRMKVFSQASLSFG
jgi:ribosomal protein S18 acetylase RimI-like enzyme